MKKQNTLLVLALAALFAFGFSIIGCGDDLDKNNGGDEDNVTTDGDTQDETTDDAAEEEPAVDGDTTEEEQVVADGDDDIIDSTDSNGEVLSDVPVEDGYPAGPYGYQLYDIMKNFKLKDCDGNDIDLKQYFTNVKAVFINQAAGWCTVCRAEATRMQNIYDTFKDDGLIILQPMFEDNAGNPANASFCKSWRDEYGFTFPVLVDSDNYFAPYHPNYPNSLATPLNVILDGNMRIQYVVEGLMPHSIEGNICRLVGRSGEECFGK